MKLKMKKLMMKKNYTILHLWHAKQWWNDCVCMAVMNINHEKDQEKNVNKSSKQ